jgi:hypothetical protein
MPIPAMDEIYDIVRQAIINRNVVAAVSEFVSLNL